jgi:hypothetical protein
MEMIKLSILVEGKGSVLEKRKKKQLKKDMFYLETRGGIDMG